jgi:subfamily B ATP-binding cassette protein HlyB/CyaB
MQKETSACKQAADSGLWALCTVAHVHGVGADESRLRHEHGPALDHCVAAGGSLTPVLLTAAGEIGLSAKAVRQDASRLDRAPLPAIARSRDGRYFIVAQYRQAATSSGFAVLLIQHAGEPPREVALPEFLADWCGELILCTSRATYAAEVARFDFTWFIPAIVRYRHVLGEVVLISLVLQVIALATPLFFQVVMDKVLVNHAMMTLDVIGIGLALATVFDVTLTGIRSWVFAHTSSKLDVELGARLFRHLLRLPITYFGARRVGDSVARVRELEHIRAFLTGNAVTLVMDLLFSAVMLAVMLRYSARLTVIVLVSIALYALLSIIFTPILRARLDTKFNRGAENQAFLVETITGIETVKAMAVEPRWTHKWDQQLASYVVAGLSVANIGTLAQAGITLVSKLVTLAIMWWGATLAINGQLSVGELVAFNMLAGQIASPIVRLAQLWNDFQQVGISMQRLGDILNARAEPTGEKLALPPVAGNIAFEHASFRYRPDGPPVLDGLSLTVSAGEVIGIVGRSGSGKSTLAKLVQRLYVPEAGRVLVDGHDLAVIDADSLRRRIGVVLQENVLFSRSVRENIALANPTVPIESVIEAAQLAGADEFIRALPQGYDTVLGEHGTGLSGGQRQRLALARALITNPRILILDEATSALDYESERIIQANMRRICAGRTVLIIAHRLSAVREADRIIVLERGRIAETGTHNELVTKPGGLYARLVQLQAGQVEETVMTDGTA